MEKIFSTKDIGLAASLITLKFKMVNIDYVWEGTKNLPMGFFQFLENEDLKEAVSKYWNSELSVEPRSFLGNIRSLRSQVSSVYKKP